MVNGKSDRLGLSKAHAKGRIPNNKNDCVKYREKAKPEQEFLAVSPPKSVENDSSNSERRYHFAD